MLRWLALAALVAAGCVSAADAQEHVMDEDFDLHPDNTTPAGIWSDGTTMWVGDSGVDRIFAYHMSNNTYYSGKDFQTPATGNSLISGIWSDGTTMWVADFGRATIFAYHTSNNTYYSDKDFAQSTLVDAGNINPADIWSDGATMWVADWNDGKIYAYGMSDKMRDTTKEFNKTKLDAGNTNPNGIWSDGTTMWVANSDPGDNYDKIFAYRMSDMSRDSTKDFNTLHLSNTNPNGIWSNNTIMWVLDSGENRIYAYKYPAPPPAPSPSPPRVFVYVPPPDTTPPTVRSVERTGNATTTNHTLTWDVRFSESVRVGLEEVHTSYTSVANATIPDLGMVHDTLLAGVPGAVTGGGVSVDLNHPITSGLLIELVAPDCTKFTIHNQTTTFPYKLRQPNDLGDLSGVGAAGQWELHVSDHAKYWNGTLNGWALYLESRGVVEGSGRTHTITQYVAGPGNYTLSLDGFDIRDRAGNRLVDTDAAVNEPYLVVGAARICHME